MDKKMTSGEIAKKAGVSQKAVRLYDEKGLLKPADYSEGNYRLYDEASLKILEKIVALKQIGFSLEEIRDSLVTGKAENVKEALKIQLRQMEEKRYQIEKVILSINRTLERKNDELDWDDVADIVLNVSQDIKADERHFDALKHTGKEQDWYEKIFESLDIHENEKVLDLGCGFAKLWRNNWEDIPRGTKVIGYDMHGSWADDFENYIRENEDRLPGGVMIDLIFEDLEDEKTWQMIKKDKDYSLIIAHYINYELKDPETFVKRACSVLSDDGMFSFNGAGISSWHIFFKKAFDEMNIKADFIEDGLKEQEKTQNECMSMLERHFKRVEKITLSNVWHYTDARELTAKLKDIFKEQEKFICRYQDKIESFFLKKIEDKGEILIEIGSSFWHCYKK
ncbi:MAG: MerR family transcriptional regulator [Lachnospiraceae bacterium]|nr:MerR family transcriptional regulator [Lachnospiraceae bacterium]